MLTWQRLVSYCAAGGCDGGEPVRLTCPANKRHIAVVCLWTRPDKGRTITLRCRYLSSSTTTITRFRANSRPFVFLHLREDFYLINWLIKLINVFILCYWGRGSWSMSIAVADEHLNCVIQARITTRSSYCMSAFEYSRGIWQIQPVVDNVIQSCKYCSQQLATQPCWNALEVLWRIMRTKVPLMRANILANISQILTINVDAEEWSSSLLIHFLSTL